MNFMLQELHLVVVLSSFLLALFTAGVPEVFEGPPRVHILPFRRRSMANLRFQLQLEVCCPLFGFVSCLGFPNERSVKIFVAALLGSSLLLSLGQALLQRQNFALGGLQCVLAGLQLFSMSGLEL